MVLGGSKNKLRTRNIKEALSRPPKMAAAAATSTSTSSSPSPIHSTPRSAQYTEAAKAAQQPLTGDTGMRERDKDIDNVSDTSSTGSAQTVFQSDLFVQFERMLHKALKQTSDHITDKLTKEIRELGQRTAELELRVDDLENHTHIYSAEFENLKEENLVLQARLEDQENRDRRSNLRIRGIPETVLDVQATMTALFQELLPAIPIERLEMDRVHRALAPRKNNGPPRDIIAKFHYYRTKEQLLAAARGKESLSFQGATYQLFADLSPLTIAKRRSMKPLLQILQQQQIPYHWGFPFSLRFTHLETKYVCRSDEQLRSALQELGFLDSGSRKDSSRRRSASRSPQKFSKTDRDHSRSNFYKRGRFDNLATSLEDSMD